MREWGNPRILWRRKNAENSNIVPRTSSDRNLANINSEGIACRREMAGNISDGMLVRECLIP